MAENVNMVESRFFGQKLNFARSLLLTLLANEVKSRVVTSGEKTSFYAQVTIYYFMLSFLFLFSFPLSKLKKPRMDLLNIIIIKQNEISESNSTPCWKCYSIIEVNTLQYKQKLHGCYKYNFLINFVTYKSLKPTIRDV